MKKTMKLFSLIAATMLIAGCNGKGGNNNNTSGNDGPNWAQDIQDEMMDLFGDVLPYAALDEESLTHEYDDSLEDFGFGMYYLYDNNETNVLDGYDDLLVQAGYEYAPYVDDSGSSTDYWDKTTAKGNVSVTFGWYEASDTDPAGNSIYVSWEILYTEESLIADGYQKVTGWPAETVAATVGGGVPTVAPVNANGDWFVGTDLWTSDDGSTECDALYLATFGDFVSDFNTGMTANNWLYDEDYECYYVNSSTVEIYAYLGGGCTLFEIYGPERAHSGGGSGGDVAGETANADGTIDVTFTFAGNLDNQTPYDGFTSTSANVALNKGSGSTAPTFYSNNDTLRCYAKNTIVISAASGLTINSVTLEVGSLKTLKANDVSASSGTLSSTGTSAPATLTISGVNANTLTITVGPNASSGNLGFSSIKVNVSSAQ